MEIRMKDTLEELTKEKFERSISAIVNSYTKLSNSAVKLFRESEFYASNGYRVKYYYNKEDNEYSYTHVKKEIGFKPPYKALKKDSPQLTLF